MTTAISREDHIRQALVLSYLEGLYQFTRNEHRFQSMLGSLEIRYKDLFKEESLKLGCKYSSTIDSAADLSFPSIRDSFENPEKFRAFIGHHYFRKFQSSAGFGSSMETDLRPLIQHKSDPLSIQGIKAAGSQFMSTLHNSDAIVMRLEAMVADSPEIPLTDDVLNRATRAVHGSKFLYERIQTIQQELLTLYLVTLFSAQVPHSGIQAVLTGRLVATKMWDKLKLVDAYTEQRANEIYRK